LLHQTEAGGTSRIKRGGVSVVGYSDDRQGIIINTKGFHTLLETVIEQYAADLLNADSGVMRTAFVRKMNYICRVEQRAEEAETGTG
jgi:hypothetical protein